MMSRHKDFMVAKWRFAWHWWRRFLSWHCGHGRPWCARVLVCAKW